MLTLKSGCDILSDVGGIPSREEAERFLRNSVASVELAKLYSLENSDAITRIANAISMCSPGAVFVHTGSVADREFVRSRAIEQGEEFPLAIEGHTCHFDLPEDQGRMVDRTFYVVNENERTNALAKSIPRVSALSYVEEHMRGIMRGKTMIVAAYSRGPLGAPASVPALEITDSFYVIHSADLLYTTAYQRFSRECDRAGKFFTNVHSMGSFSSAEIEKARIFMDRSWLTTFSLFCTYAGNTLMLKKGNHRFAVDLAVSHGKGRELSEHMFITGLRGPGERTTYFAGAAPSGCGKTTTAMVGTDFIGDDLAQLWISSDGSLRAVNPEIGIFGIVQDVNYQSDPYLMRCLREPGSEVVWSNVLVDEELRPRWAGDGEPAPKGGKNWLGEWHAGKKDSENRPIPVSHPNSRVTLRSTGIRNYNAKAATDPEGVPIGVITYSGRDSDTMPPVWVAKSPDAGVVIGASILSAATATEVGATGVKRQPWANSAFIPGSLADYMRVQFEFFNSPSLSTPPLIAGLNYFLTHQARGSSGKGLLGEKRDVIVWLTWLELRAHDEVGAIDSPIGLLPMYDDLARLFGRLIEKDYPRDLYTLQFSLYVDRIISRIDLQEDSYRCEDNVPAKLFEIYAEQRSGLMQLKRKYGAIVPPETLIVDTGVRHAGSWDMEAKHVDSYRSEH